MRDPIVRADRLTVVDYEKAFADLTKWAQRNDDVRALVMTGSGGAKTAHPLSDRDIEVYTTDVEALVDDESWWSGLGDVLVVERLENADADPTRLVYYIGGKLDFTLVPADRLNGMTYERPFKILLDKDEVAASLRLSTPATGEVPDAADFEEAVDWAYAAALMCAKAVVRDELWAAKFRDNDLKEQLLQMVEWDHRSRYGADYDTRYLGTRMNQWMDADIRQSLLGCWGHLDAVDTVRALRTLSISSQALRRAPLCDSPCRTSITTA